MVAKYTRLLKERAINDKTGEVWKITDVPKTWRQKTEAQVLADGYVFDEDGTVIKPDVKKDADIPVEEESGKVTEE